MISEEEKDAIKLLKDIENNSWSTKYIMSSDSKNATTILNLIEIQNKMIELMAEELKEITGSCPLDIFDYDLDCENKCEQEIDGKCWAEYFRNKAKESE